MLALALLLAAPLEISWHGQSCFSVRTPAGATVLLDPVAYGIGFKPPVVKADLVTVSHEHPDHKNLAMVEVAGAAAGGAEVVHAIAKNGEWSDVDLSIADVRVTTVRSYHDADSGKRLGRNGIVVLDVAGRRLVHLGDLGHPLDKEQIAGLGRVDVLMIPVGGGGYTLGGAEARAVVQAIRPRTAILPMHFKTPALRVKELDGPDTFLEGLGNVIRVDGNTFTVPETPPAVAPVVLLSPE